MTEKFHEANNSFSRSINHVMRDDYWDTRSTIALLSPSRPAQTARVNQGEDTHIRRTCRENPRCLLRADGPNESQNQA